MDPANFTASQINNSIFRSELTGITKGYFQQRFRTSGFYNPCIHLELNVSECFEAYGLYRGNRYCRDYLSDWKECAQQPNSSKRKLAMDEERFKQAMAGERGFDRKSFWGRRVVADSYISGPYQPV